MKRDIDASGEVIIEAVRAHVLKLKEDVDRAVAKSQEEIICPIAAEAVAANKQLSNLVDLGPILLKTNDLGLVAAVANLEDETMRLLALKSEALTAPRPPLTCLLEPDVVVAAVKTSLQSPSIAPPTTMPQLKFTNLGAQTQAYDEGLRVRHSGGSNFAVATCSPQLFVGAAWKLKINAMSSHIWVGIIGTTDTSVADTRGFVSSHLWGSLTQVYVAGQHTSSYGGWVGFQTGDVCIFKLEGEMLRMRCARLGAAIFDIPLTGAGPWYAHVNLYQPNNEVVLLPTTEKDVSGM